MKEKYDEKNINQQTKSFFIPEEAFLSLVEDIWTHKVAEDFKLL